jgi:hypothetical protein
MVQQARHMHVGHRTQADWSEGARSTARIPDSRLVRGFRGRQLGCPCAASATLGSIRVRLRSATQPRRHQLKMKASKNPRSEWKEGHDATDSKASDSPFPRGVMRPITSGRSPGSWFPRVFEPSSPPSSLPQAQMNLSGSNERRLPTYSGGTAPASHRLPFYAPMGTQSDQKYSSVKYAGPNCLSRKVRSTLFFSSEAPSEIASNSIELMSV